MLVRSTPSQACGILYAEDFDDEPAVPELAPDPEPVFSAADLESARVEAADSARVEAMASAELAALHSRNAALVDVSTGLRQLADTVTAEVERSATELSRVVLSLLCAALPSLMESTAAREVSSLLSRLLPGLHGEKQVAVRLSPHLMERVAADLLTLDEESRSRVTLIPTDALQRGDVNVSWRDGHLLRDTGAIHRATQAVLAAAGQLEVTGG